MSDNQVRELITCNRCRHQWHASIADECPECASFNIEIGEGRSPEVVKFKPGDWVRFRGLKIEHLKKAFKPYYGKLRAKPSAAPGCVKIEGEPLGLIFNPDGTLYCHAHYGILLDQAKPLKNMKPEGQERKDETKKS